jgi:hypothetical protein
MMKLGLFFEGCGHHIAAWRDPEVDAHARQSLAHYVEIAQLAERGKFDFLFTADTNATFGPDDADAWTRTTAASRLEPITLLGALAAVTQRVGLVATATTTYFEPFHVARFFASLDQISSGRAGWNLVTSLAVAEAYNFGREAHARRTGTRAPTSSPRSFSDCGTAGRTTRLSPTRSTGFTSTAPSCTSSITRASSSRCADRSPCTARRKVTQ